MAIAPVLALPLLLFAPGYVTLASWQRARDLDFWERLFLASFISILLTSWVGLALAETGVFSLTLLSLVVALYSLAVAIFARGRLQPGWLGRPSLDKTSLLLIAIMLLAGWAFSRPAEVVSGTFDPGIYLGTGASIAHYGSIAIQDPFLSQMEQSLRPFLIEQRGEIGVGAVRLPAFWMPQASGNTVIPAFFHLYPVWLAILYSVGGLQAALLVSPIFGFMGVWALFLLGRRLMGPGVALLAAALLAINPAQIWFARYPISETTIQMFLLGGLTLWVLMEERRSRLLAVLAGVSLGLAHLAKVDQVFVPVTVALSLLLVWIFRQRTGRDAPVGRLRATPEANLTSGTVAPSFPVSEDAAPAFPKPEAPAHSGPADVAPARLYMLLLIPYAFLLIHSAVHVYVFSFAYTWINLGPYLPALRSTPAVILYVAVALPLITALAFREEASIIGRRLAAHRSRASLGLTVVVVVAAAYGYFLWPLSPEPVNSVFLSSDGVTPVYMNMFREEGLVRLGWYLTPLGLLLGLAGFIRFAAWNSDHRSLPLLVLFSCQSVFYLLTAGMAYPVHFWAIRRYVPLVIPVFLLLASFLLTRLRLRTWPWGRQDGSPTRLYLPFGQWHRRATSFITTPKPPHWGFKVRLRRFVTLRGRPPEIPAGVSGLLHSNYERPCGDEPPVRLYSRFHNPGARGLRPRPGFQEVSP
ncbi:MAG: glycosyltransferase family 39 protein [Dehalococcoidia bacterium]|nr:glycosyltransferase family 39 protein [Dehalococcoidia bacterium]